MDNKEAIKYLIPPIATSTEPSAEYLKQKEAYDLAIKALEKRPQGEWICITEGNLGINAYKCSLCGHRITCTEGAMKQHKGCYCGAVMGDGSEGQ